MKILIVEPFYGGSHKLWIDGLINHSAHSYEVISLEDKNWKWRMEGGGITLSEKYLETSMDYDLILASDMLNLPLFLSLIKDKLNGAKTAIYLHENQFNHPVSGHDNAKGNESNLTYGFINFSSALVADKVFFNSEFHKAEFLSAIKNYLKSKYDYKELNKVEIIENKSIVLPVGMDFTEIDKIQRDSNCCRKVSILWNHRWEFDKNGEEFFKLIRQIDDNGYEFELIVLGEDTDTGEELFKKAKEEFAHRIIHFGYVKDYPEYVKLLKKSDILPVTSNHDFFGCSVVEAIRAGVLPLLPNRLAYHEHLSNDAKQKYIYKSYNHLYAVMEELLSNVQTTQRADRSDLTHFVGKYSWSNVISDYDKEFSII